MPATALALALGAAFLHAFWNLLLARAPNIEATTAVALVVGVVAFAPVAALAWEAESEVVPFLVVTSLLQLAYFVLLTAAYGRAELSFVYPIARGSAPVIVLVVALAVLGEAASVAQVAGVLVVAAGVLLVRGVSGRATAADLGLALAVGCCIAAYTLVDSRGIQYASPVVYQELSMIPATLAFLLLDAAAPRPTCSPRGGRPGVHRCRARDLRRVHPGPGRARACACGPGRRRARDERGHRDAPRRAAPPRARRPTADRRRGGCRLRRRPARDLAQPDRRGPRSPAGRAQRELASPPQRRRREGRASALRAPPPCPRAARRCSPVASAVPSRPCSSV